MVELWWLPPLSQGAETKSTQKWAYLESVWPGTPSDVSGPVAGAPEEPDLQQ